VPPGEVYKLLIEGIDPWARAAGFRRAWRWSSDAFPKWSRRDGGGHLVLWCQHTNEPWNERIGSKFTVELQRGAWRFIDVGRVERRRLWRLLDEPERARLRLIQSGISDAPDLDTDTWFRYRASADVRGWATFISDVLPAAISRFG
jgi:hypothetical protein